MTQTNNLQKQSIQGTSFAKPTLVGAGIGLFLISLFLIGIRHANPEWGKFWMIRPLILVPLAGATGGTIFHLFKQLGSRGILNRTLAFLIGLVVFIVGLWMGFVLGLNGTLWN